jgi:hypothetical protein
MQKTKKTLANGEERTNEEDGEGTTHTYRDGKAEQEGEELVPERLSFIRGGEAVRGCAARLGRRRRRGLWEGRNRSREGDAIFIARRSPPPQPPPLLASLLSGSPYLARPPACLFRLVAPRGCRSPWPPPARRVVGHPRRSLPLGHVRGT